MDVVIWKKREIVFPLVPSSALLPMCGWAGSVHTAAVLRAGIGLSYSSQDSLLEVRDRQQESTKARFGVGGKQRRKHPVPCVLSPVCYFILPFCCPLSLPG